MYVKVSVIGNRKSKSGKRRLLYFHWCYSGTNNSLYNFVSIHKCSQYRTILAIISSGLFSVYNNLFLEHPIMLTEAFEIFLYFFRYVLPERLMYLLLQPFRVIFYQLHNTHFVTMRVKNMCRRHHLLAVALI